MKIDPDVEGPRKVTKEELYKVLQKIKETNEELYRHICGLIRAASK